MDLPHDDHHPRRPRLDIPPPRRVHLSYLGFINPIQTDEGERIGLKKQLAISASLDSGWNEAPGARWRPGETVLGGPCAPLVCQHLQAARTLRALIAAQKRDV
jgi:hypothetical protein